MPKDAAEKVERAQDPDWDCKHEGTAKYYRKEPDGSWKGLAKGVLRLEQHKTDKTNCRMVIRDFAGKVQLNLKIAQNMPLEQNSHTQKGQTKTYISFMAVQNAEKGAEHFMLQVKPQNLEATMSVLKSLTKSTNLKTSK